MTIVFMNESNQSVWQPSLLAKIFSVPVVLCLFFTFAPMWQNSSYIDSILENLDRNPEITDSQKLAFRAEFEKMNLEQSCDSLDETPSDFVLQLHANGYCDGFRHLRWGMWFSILSLGLLALNLFVTYIFSLQAAKSASHLLLNYKLAWRMNLVFVFVQLLMLAPLLAYGLFALTTLLLSRYFPQLILMLLFAAVYALAQCLRSLFEKVPMEFGEYFARQVQRSESPRLWSDIEAIAAKLGAPAPENIVVGLSENFYVTELGVRTSQGVTKGRTLYLSYFLMKYLNPQEVMSIVGHELGHFHGEDTKSTRELYPMIYRVNQSLWILESSGWAALIVRQMLMQFAVGFKWPEQKLSRERELAADRFGARYIDHKQMAQALVKVNVLSRAFQLSLHEDRDEEVNLIQFYNAKMADDHEFWQGLSQFKTPHPLDSHPMLADRMKNLGIDPKPGTLQELARFSGDASAYSVWFGENEKIFEEMRSSWIETLINSAIEKVDLSTVSGQELLKSRFPPIRWQAKVRRFWKTFVIFVAFGLLMVASAFIAPKLILKIIFLAFGLFALWMSYFFFRNHYQGVLEIDHEGVSYSGFREKILFVQVADLGIQKIAGVDYLIFYFREPRARLLKLNLFTRAYKAEQLPISDFDAPPSEIVAKVSAYLLRKST